MATAATFLTARGHAFTPPTAMVSAATSPESHFDAGELALIVRTEASAFRMREIRRVAVQLSPDEAERLALKLLAYSAQARRPPPAHQQGHDDAALDSTGHV